MERPPEAKKEEQCPLLKVEIGMPDNVRQPTTVPQNWSVTCLPKKSWIQRWPDWPEVVAASWMIFTLLVMSFFLCYALCMARFRKEPLLLNHNNAKPVSNVFLHHIVNRGCRLPLEVYAQYLELMALTYPNLRINMFFLIDDGVRHPYYIPRHGRMPGRWLTYPNRDLYVKHSCVKEFEKRHPNINITIMTLNKFMAMTPLRFKWRSIPVPYLTFYARVFSVWQNGGIAMDITYYNNLFSNNFRVDRRINEILRNENNGVPVQDYNVVLRAIDEEEDDSYKHLKQIINDTLSMFNSIFSVGWPSLTDVLLSNDTSIVRTERSKRDSAYNFYDTETSEKTLSTTENMLNEVGIISPNTTIDDLTIILKEDGSKNDSLENEVPQTTVESTDETTSEVITEANKEPAVNLVPGDNNKSHGPQAVLFYDFSIMSDKLGNFLMNEPMWPTFMYSGSYSKSEPVDDIAKTNITKPPAQLALNSDGIFVAASYMMHPFLGMLMTAGSQRVMRPDFAIQETFLTQCSGPNRNQPYCSIYNM